MVHLYVYIFWNNFKEGYSKKKIWSYIYFLKKILFIFIFCLFVLWGPHQQHMEVPRLGSNRSCSSRPTSRPQQCQIRAVSSTYTTAHGNGRSLTHWARPGIKPTISWLQVGFISTTQWQKLPIHFIFNVFFLFMAALAAHGSSQARGQTGAAAPVTLDPSCIYDLCHSL